MPQKNGNPGSQTRSAWDSDWQRIIAAISMSNCRSSRRIGSYEIRQSAKDGVVAARIIEASSRYPRFGYRRIAVMTGQSMGRVWRLWGQNQEASLWKSL